jgi:hypothetical protein
MEHFTTATRPMPDLDRYSSPFHPCVPNLERSFPPHLSKPPGDYITSRIWRLGGWSSFRCASQADLVSLLRRWKTRQSRRKALMSAQLFIKRRQPETRQQGHLVNHTWTGCQATHARLTAKFWTKCDFVAKNRCFAASTLFHTGNAKPGRSCRKQFSFQGVFFTRMVCEAHRSCKTDPYPRYPGKPPRR